MSVVFLDWYQAEEVLDADASAYIAAVEAIDGQALETDVRWAINKFFLYLKANSLWANIHRAVLLSAARTLAGSFVDIKTAAVICTTSTFTDSDYNRVFGVTQSSLKSITVNYNANNLSQNNCHIGCYATVRMGSSSFIKNFWTGPAGLNQVNSFSPPWQITLMTGGGIGSYSDTAARGTSGFKGAFRNSSANYQIWNDHAAQGSPIVAASSAPGSGNITICQSNTAGGSTNYGTMSSFTMGNYVDPDTLDTAFANFAGDLTWALDSDAKAWINAIEAADGQALEPAVKSELGRFVLGLKVHGVWAPLNNFVLMCGARTLAGALVPMKGVAPTSHNFTAGDYNRKTGLLSDGTTKYLDTNVNANSNGQSTASFLMGTWLTQRPEGNVGSNIYVMGNTPATGRCGLRYRTTSNIIDGYNVLAHGNSSAAVAGAAAVGPWIWWRRTTTSYGRCYPSSTAFGSFGASAIAADNSNILVFGANNGSGDMSLGTASRLACYFLGTDPTSGGTNNNDSRLRDLITMLMDRLNAIIA